MNGVPVPDFLVYSEPCPKNEIKVLAIMMESLLPRNITVDLQAFLHPIALTSLY